MNSFRHDLDLLALALSSDNYPRPSTAKPDSTKKRKIDEISTNGAYEDTNSELRELYMLRKLRTEANKDIPNPNGSNTPEKILLNYKTKENNTPIEETKIENPVKEVVSEPVVARKETPDIWISKLKNYPDDYLTDNMMTFEKLVSEDLKGNNRGRTRTTLQGAFFTSFGYSLDLIEPLLRQGVKIVLADDWKNINEPRIEKSFPEYPSFTLIRSPKDPTKNYQGTFHAKLMLLKFPNFLRVVVSSGNLTHDDWSILSNCLWFKDFPKKSTVQQQPQKTASNEFDYDTDFRTTLTSFLQSLMPTPGISYPSLLGINIDDYYISDIDIVLIPSIPGRHTGPDLEKYGHRKIGTVLKKLAASSKDTVKPKKQILTYQTSSLGNLEERFLKEILSSFVPSYIKVEDLQQRKKNANPVTVEPASNRVKVIFPTKQYVENCNEGPQSAYCISLNGKEYQKETFPKQIFHQFEAPEHYAFHDGVVPHLKVFLVTEEDSEINDDSYMYLGSHNFSASAWGRYEGPNKISIYNTELGILIPPAKGSKQRKVDMLNGLSFKFPPTKYARNQVPWTITYNF